MERFCTPLFLLYILLFFCKVLHFLILIYDQMGPGLFCARPGPKFPILQKYEKERLDNRKQEILKQLDIEKDGEKKKQLGKELSNIIIALAKIK